MRAVASRGIEGHLPEDAAIGRAQALEASVDFAGAVAVYEELLQRKLALRTPCSRGSPPRPKPRGTCPSAIEAFRRVYFEFPLAIESSIGRKRTDAASTRGARTNR